MFLICLNCLDKVNSEDTSFNPLNQVYVFNQLVNTRRINMSENGFNPLNQVYVFNENN